MHNLIKAVLFDLDDTIFDHKHSRRMGLKALQHDYPELKTVPLKRLEEEHETLLNSSYLRVLDGKVSVAEGISERIRNLCSMHGLSLDLEESRVAADLYNLEYLKHRRAIPGIVELLRFLREHVKTGIVTNGLVAVQAEKIRVCQVRELIDFAVVSEEIGYRKPGREIFMEALRRANAGPFETVYVGDSWLSDVMPAHQCGFRTVWINRYGSRCPDLKITTEIKSYKGLDYRLFL